MCVLLFVRRSREAFTVDFPWLLAKPIEYTYVGVFLLASTVVFWDLGDNCPVINMWLYDDY